MADRPLLNLVRAKRLLINLVRAGCHLLDSLTGASAVWSNSNLARAGRVMLNLVRAAPSIQLSSPAQKLVRTCCQLLNLVRVGRRLLNLVRVGHRLLTQAGHRLF